MDRREFIITGAAAAAASAFPWGLIGAEPVKSLVWEVQGTTRASIKTIFSALGGVKTLGGMAKLADGDVSRATVLVKPNLCLPHPARMATTTSPEVIRALCEYLSELGVKRIIIADHTLQKTESFDKTEIAKLGEAGKSVKLVFANERRFFEPVEVEGKILKKTEVLKSLSRADLVINVATAKHHSATHVSLAAKNLMGLIWDRSEFHTRLDLHQAIGDLALAIQPDLNIIDASRVLLNGGPTGPGPVSKDGRLFAGKDIVALDSVVASRYDFGGRTLAPTEIAHLRAAHNNGVGEIDLAKIEIVKLDVESKGISNSPRAEDD
jgi:uncharacterized protein (DUF362 family)